METFASVLALLSLPALSQSFVVPLSNGSVGTRSSSTNGKNRRGHRSVVVGSNISRIQKLRRNRFIAFAGKDDDDEMSIGPGMEDAFKELEALQSLGDENAPERPKGKPKEKDKAFAKAIEGLDLKDILAQEGGGAATSTPESEVELFRDMASEIDAASSEEELIAADFKSDLEMEIEIVESGDASGMPTVDTQKFMDKAIKEALQEAKQQDSSVDVADAKEAFLDNKEIMSEIEKIFDKANDDLLEELEEIRIEQVRACFALS